MTPLADRPEFPKGVTIGEGKPLRGIHRNPDGTVFELETSVRVHDCHRIEGDLKTVDAPANVRDWAGPDSSQSYQLYRCFCGALWGCRHQWDAGTGHDDRWHKFPDGTTLEEATRHY